ncbi:MAG: hypothetical protein JNM27_02125 [Leptospirales bacterium]|nr:hypothetical protein [Leptospirales bacterium]
MTGDNFTQHLFHQTVVLFEWVCGQTGLSYALLNILVYCLVVPALWTAILCIRKGWMGALFLGGVALCSGGYALVSHLNARQIAFYDRQISLLYRIAQNQESLYMSVSVIMGIAVPIVVTATLLLIPRRYLLLFYLAVHIVLAGFLGYGWSIGAS